MIDDEKFENQEKFYLQMNEPVMAIIEEPSRAAVILVDAEDGKILIKMHVVKSIYWKAGKNFSFKRPNNNIN